MLVETQYEQNLCLIVSNYYELAQNIVQPLGEGK